MHHIKFSEKEIKLLIETFENSRNAVLSIENKLKILTLVCGITGYIIIAICLIISAVT